MRIIPVLDILRGQVVHAYRGERQHYRPIRSRLCSTSVPEDILDALLTRYPFEIIYCADLDAIQNLGNNQEIIQRLADTHSTVEFWLDKGIADLSSWSATPNIIPVIGSECLTTIAEFEQLKIQFNQRCILSLDFCSEQFIGPAELLHTPMLWPDRVIVMSLDRVGSGLGPDHKKLKAFQTLAPKHQVFAAGGVRHEEDLRHLAENNITGVLIASALHDGRILASLPDWTQTME